MKRNILTTCKAAATAIFLIMAGCFVAQSLGLIPDASPRFSHKVHVKDNGADCADCHGEVTDAKMKFSTKSDCMECHEGDAQDRPVEKRVDTLFPNNTIAWAHEMALPEEVKFSHQKHMDAKMTCLDCHQGMDTNTAITSAVRMKMDQCVSCHNERKVVPIHTDSNISECRVCHSNDMVNEKPKSHNRNWDHIHGQVVRSGGNDETINDCALCHTRSSCTQCHEDQAPDNHNASWRHRTHGLSAKINRENCAACHRSDYCNRCHESTAPRNHTPGWEDKQHCTTCHLPIQTQEGCNMCHRVNHETATEKPAWHRAGMDCRSCHVGTNAPKHYDDAVSSCTYCHNK